MRRRDFVTLLGGAATWPLAARAQQPALPVIGFLHPQTAATAGQVIGAFRAGLESTGFVEGRNVAIEYRWAEGRNDRLPALAAELVRLGVVAVAAPGGDSSAFALKAATTTIPIVSAFASDPIRNGFVASLNRPAGNFTGVYRFGGELEPKRLELLCEAIPSAAEIDLLVNPEGAITAASTRDLESAARQLGRRVRIHKATNDTEIDAAFAALSALRSGALHLMGDSYFTSRSRRIGALTVRHAIPAIYNTRDFALAGGLMSYVASEVEPYRLVGSYVGRVLKGEKPADLPVQQATRVELIINMKTAKALGLTFPLTLLGRADEVIE